MTEHTGRKKTAPPSPPTTSGHHGEFINRMASKEAVIGVVGLGYVGLPLIIGYEALGYKVLGFDIDKAKTRDLGAGKSYIGHIEDARIAAMNERGRFEATTDFSRIDEADTLLLCVPTPLSRHREPDMSYVTGTATQIAPFLRPGQLIVLESTTWPGTTRELLAPLLEKGSGLKADEQIYIAYSPEREDPGNMRFDTTTMPKVVGARSPEGLAMVTALYKPLCPHVVEVSSPETAEAVKLTENIFRSVNIALVNELKTIFMDMDIDIWEVIDAAKTKPFGFMPFYPGPGLGGHCIPIDPFYLTWKAHEYGHHTRFIELAGEINKKMPNHVIIRLAVALSKYQQKALSGAKILLVGLAYKPDVDDMRESPTFDLMDILARHEAAFDYYDPFIPVIRPTREHAAYTGMKSISWEPEKLAGYDAVLIATDHSEIDWHELATHARLIVDTRNACAGLPANLQKKVVKA